MTTQPITTTDRGLWLQEDDVDTGHAATVHLTAEQARALRDTLDELLRQHRMGDESEPERRRPTLGGSIDGTGAWCVDDLAPPAGVNVVTMDDPPRPALRDPDGGAWASWLALPALADLRAQLAVAAALTQIVDAMPGWHVSVAELADHSGFMADVGGYACDAPTPGEALVTLAEIVQRARRSTP